MAMNEDEITPEEGAEEEAPATVEGIAFDAIDLPDIADVQLDAELPSLEDDATKYAVRFGIIGAGQGGGRIASQFWALGHRRVVLVNTTEADFRGQTGSTKVVLPTGEGQAAGAGKDPAVARVSIAKNGECVRDAIRDYIGEDVDRILITIGGGGGTGTGCAVGVLEIARQFMSDSGKDPRSVGIIVSKPKASEGAQVQENFADLMVELKDLEKAGKVSPVVVVDNELINKRFPRAGVAQFWQIANSNLCGLFDIFNIIAANVSQFASFDKADYESVLNSGNLVFGHQHIKEYTTTSALCDAIRSNVKKNLLGEEFDLSTATHAAGILVADSETLQDLPQAALDEAMRTLNRVLGNNVTLHQGVYPGNKEGLHLYTLVGGMKA
jgi:cell division GTPase FtsZ